MRKKLWPKAPAKEGAIAIEPKSYTAMLLYLFFDSLLSACQKKMETEKWPKAADSPLNRIFFFNKSIKWQSYLAKSRKIQKGIFKNLLNNF